MTSTTVVPASRFARNFAQYQDRALSGEIIKVTSHGRVVGGYLSVQELEHFERLKRREQESLVVGELPEDVVADIEGATYGEPP